LVIVLFYQSFESRQTRLVRCSLLCQAVPDCGCGVAESSVGERGVTFFGPHFLIQIDEDCKTPMCGRKYMGRRVRRQSVWGLHSLPNPARYLKPQRAVTYFAHSRTQRFYVVINCLLGAKVRCAKMRHERNSQSIEPVCATCQAGSLYVIQVGAAAQGI
jgi:hypothetical protein